MRKILLILIILAVIFSTGVFAANSDLCNPEIKLISQDPYPAIPGEYVKLVFQVTGVTDPTCGTIKIKLDNQFPIKFDPGTSNQLSFQSGIYAKDFQSFIIAPFKVIVDKDAIDGENDLKLRYSVNSERPDSSFIEKDFKLSVNNSLTDFDVIIESYSYDTNALTLSVLNKGKSDAAALIIKIPKQETISISGSNEKIIGELKSNDDNTVSFSGFPTTGEINVILEYNDLTNNRRSINKTVIFDERAFPNPNPDGKKSNPTLTALLISWALFIIYFVYRYFKNKRKRKADQAKRFS